MCLLLFGHQLEQFLLSLRTECRCILAKTQRNGLLFQKVVVLLLGYQLGLIERIQFLLIIPKLSLCLLLFIGKFQNLLFSLLLQFLFISYKTKFNSPVLEQMFILPLGNQFRIQKLVQLLLVVADILCLPLLVAHQRRQLAFGDCPELVLMRHFRMGSGKLIVSADEDVHVLLPLFEGILLDRLLIVQPDDCIMQAGQLLLDLLDSGAPVQVQ